jgi:hypothetical protein
MSRALICGWPRGVAASCVGTLPVAPGMPPSSLRSRAAAIRIGSHRLTGYRQCDGFRARCARHRHDLHPGDAAQSSVLAAPLHVSGRRLRLGQGIFGYEPIMLNTPPRSSYTWRLRLLSEGQQRRAAIARKGRPDDAAVRSSAALLLGGPAAASLDRCTLWRTHANSKSTLAFERQIFVARSYCARQVSQFHRLDELRARSHTTDEQSDDDFANEPPCFRPTHRCGRRTWR